jgi:hypothetical protein
VLVGRLCTDIIVSTGESKVIVDNWVAIAADTVRATEIPSDEPGEGPHVAIVSLVHTEVAQTDEPICTVRVGSTRFEKP